jgi:hypothetical protein
VSRLDEIRSRMRYIPPAPWQRSFFTPGPHTARWPDIAIDEARQMEARTIRGPGEIGTPGCNVVFRLDRLDGALLEFLAHSRSDIEYLLSEVERLQREKPIEEVSHGNT